jgi:hypothetical protein
LIPRPPRLYFQGMPFYKAAASIHARFAGACDNAAAKLAAKTASTD